MGRNEKEEEGRLDNIEVKERRESEEGRIRVREEEFTYFNNKILSFYQILSPPQLGCGIIFSIQMAEMNIYELREVSLTH